MESFEEVVSFRKKINWKKVVIALIIFIIVISIALFFLLRENNVEVPLIPVSSTTYFVDITNSISFSMPKKYGLSLSSSDPNRILELSSSDLFIFVSFEGIFGGGASMSELILKDRDNYLKNYENVSNVSDLYEETFNDIKTYYYSFNYDNAGDNYVLETIWVEGNNGYYIIDVTYKTEKQDKFVNLHSDLLNSIAFIENEEATNEISE